MLTYQDRAIFVYGFNHKTWQHPPGLNQLQVEKLLVGTVEVLSVLGYRNNYFAVGRNESLLSLATAPLSRTLKQAREPRALPFQHCYAESAVVSHDVSETDIALRTRYFAAEVMRELQLDHLPYFCSFATGCSEFISVLITAAGLFPSPRRTSGDLHNGRLHAARGSLRHGTRTNPRQLRLCRRA
jgi:hypothetical protein